ncbi:pilus assembly PilX N-terminal domain-containing protein [Deefgea rivuli]|uniref:pilus assembly PilX N-terminal domain-containing protein n=1 Tax=Deefgea rivuli TaxID=400948 RepID=UPI0004888C11|nr:pilus assembly PilX N-terminal domain-containing protein [Deefgea rivuli]
MKTLKKESGIATLLVTIVLTLIVTITLLSLNKTTITENRSNNNYYYKNIATEKAQAAISAFIAELSDEKIIKSYLNNTNKLKTEFDCSNSTPGKLDCIETEKNITLDSKFAMPVGSTLRASQLPDLGLEKAIRIWAISCMPDVNCATATTDAKTQVFQDIYYQSSGGGTGDWLSVNKNLNRPWDAAVEVRGLPFGTEGGMGYGNNNNTCKPGTWNSGSQTYTDCISDPLNTGYFIRNADGSEGGRNTPLQRGEKTGDEYFAQYFGETKADFQSNPDLMSKVIWINGDATMTATGQIIGGGNTYTPGLTQMIVITGNLNMGQPWPGGTSVTTGASADPNNPAAFYWGLLYVGGNANFGCNCNLGGRIAVEGDMNAYSSISIFPPSDGSNPPELFKKMKITNKTGWRDF